MRASKQGVAEHLRMEAKEAARYQRSVAGVDALKRCRPFGRPQGGREAYSRATQRWK